MSKIAVRIVVLVLLWLLFECWISWAAFCQEPEEYAGAYQAAEKYDCVFRGPTMMFLGGFVSWWNNIFDKPDAYVALFTAVLAISTIALWWWTRKTLRHTEETAIREFRAYIVGIAWFGVPNSENPSIREIYRPKASDYHGPWHLHLLNFGKTPGVILKVEWGTCPESKFPKQRKVSDIIDRNLLSNFMRPTIEGMNEICLPDPKPQQYRHVHLDERVAGEVIFGRITYRDIFRKIHHSTFALLIQREHTDTITMSFADDWS